MEISERQKGRAIADYSADFEVEDVIPVPRLPRDTDNGRVTRLHKAASAKANGPLSFSGAPPKQPIASLDPHRLAQRQKQIDYGKNTIGYQRYLQQVPKDRRRRKGEQWLDPVTPDIHQNISKRCFDGQIKVWRRALHKYDHQEEEQHVRPLSYAERTRVERLREDAIPEDVAAISAAPSSPTNSSRSQGSLDGYLESHIGDGGRKRCFQRAFDHVANGNPHPSKLMTSPAGPKPVVPQSAPPATAADTEPGPLPAGRCVGLPSRPGCRAVLPRGAGSSSFGMPKAPQTAPPASAARITAGSTADAHDDFDVIRSELGTAAAENLFREWEDDGYVGLEPLEDEELDQVQL
ncbi:hypothetical protein VaNZ11_017031 [Volvox africanus]|uniref:Histone RNA hairpin-binding protein RNA-binding domain-containing protein n=1 Tax=Volvox africanus TaxID=51714 RepID=A0ABQ5SP97_9CHLO|nr:hypothetical protein VaNZ11_017031 [Volvox africanus]